MKTLIKCVSLLALTFAVACHEDAPQIPANKIPADPTEANLEEFNKGYVEYEENEIKHYIDSLHLKMARSPEGIWFSLPDTSGKKLLKLGDKVVMRYSISLLNGQTCPKLTNKEARFTIGDGSVQQGIDLSLRMMKKGETGTFIIPALLAYGVSGYGDCVPSWTPVICKMTLIDKEKIK